MTLVREYQPTFVLGDGETKEFSYLFEEVSENFIKVIVKHSDDSTYVPVFSVDLDSHKVVFGESETAPLDTDLVCIYRQTPDLQDTPFRTLQGYDAKALENILSKIVAMIQELKANGFSTQILQGTPWQLDLLHPADDGASVVVDYNARILKKGLYFQIVSGNLQVSADGNSFISMPKSADITEFRCLETVLEDLTVVRKLQYKVNNVWYDAEHNAQATADEALDLAQTVQGDLSSHKLNHNNPHETSLGNLTDTDITSLQVNQFLKFNGTKWVNVYSSAIASWGGIIGTITDQTDLMNKFSEYVKTDGSSTMTAPLKFRAGSMRGAVGPYLNGVSFWKLDSQGNITNIANLTDSQFLPVTTNSIDLGRSANKWKDLYLGGKAYVATLNNGADLSVPNKSGTLATMGDVELAARSGRMITDQGVWYAKMYAASTVPTGAEYDGKNYADFSQVDGDNNPIIVIYEGQSGAWVQTETITPPAEYDGYVPITSKIWDIAEQSGQQGGRVLWNHVSKEFTPYPTIISFEDIEITGTSTVIMPNNPSANQIVNKDYVDNSIGDGTITITQGGTTKGTFTTNQSGDTTIDLDAGGSGGYHPDLFDWKWADHQLNDVQWLRADTFSWQSGSVYQAAFDELFYDIQISTYWYSSGGPAYTKSRTPAVGDAVYLNSDLTTQIGTVDSYDNVNDEITVSGNTYSYMSNTYVTPTTETVAGYSLSVYTGHSGRKIVSVSDETNVANIYTAIGVAWYYILDIPNKQFKLPRVNPDLVKQGYGSTPVVGDGTELGFDYNSNKAYMNSHNESLGINAGWIGTYMSGSGTKTSIGNMKVSTDATQSGLIVGTQSVAFAGKKYLYFYVGEFTQTALENTAGITAETLNDKADTDFGNTNMIDYVVAKQDPTAGNSYTWYRKYKSGWVEQGGYIAALGQQNTTIALPVEMADTNYTVQVTNDFNDASNQYGSQCNGRSATQIIIKCGSYSSGDQIHANWQVSGMSAS